MFEAFEVPEKDDGLVVREECRSLPDERPVPFLLDRETDLPPCGEGGEDTSARTAETDGAAVIEFDFEQVGNGYGEERHVCPGVHEGMPDREASGLVARVRRIIG